MNHNAKEETTTLTPLASAVQAAAGSGTAQPPHREHHRQVNWLRDVILGGQDGLVNILGIVLGVIAGGGSKTVLLAAGFAPGAGVTGRSAHHPRGNQVNPGIHWARTR
jgi:hypothetical protein